MIPEFEPDDLPKRRQAFSDIAREVWYARDSGRPEPSLPAWLADWRLELRDKISAWERSPERTWEAAARPAAEKFRKTRRLELDEWAWESEWIVDILWRFVEIVGYPNPIVWKPGDEIIDEETGEWVPDGEVPDVTATRLRASSLADSTESGASRAQPELLGVHSTEASAVTESTPQPQRDRIHAIPSAIAGVMLLLAVGDRPSGYYDVLRWVVFGAALFAGVIAIDYAKERAEQQWAWIAAVVYAAAAVLFNPFMPIYLNDRSTWAPIDVFVSVIMFAGIGLSTYRGKPRPGAAS